MRKISPETLTEKSNPPTDLNTVLILGGATGCGKNALALKIAQSIPSEIVNADSRQIYAGLSIGTNQPVPVELASVPHHLFGFLEPSRPFSMADYECVAYPIVRDIQSRGKLPIVVGGTGFY